MCLCDIVDLEEALRKTGPDLFKELYRVYPVADPEDYFRNGQWRNDLMKSDLTLLEAHRRDAGAPDPPDMDTIKFPQMPMQAAAPALGGLKLAAGQQGATGATGAVGAASEVANIRLIALFVAKWKLDPATSKECLSKLTIARRRYVIQKFKATSTGMEATEELKTFIAECEKDGAWDTGATSATSGIANGAISANESAKGGATARATITPKLSPLVSTAKPATIVPASGLKRPLPQTISPATNKRPTLASPANVKPNAIIPKAGGAATIRPPVRPGGKLISGLLKSF